jgi:hypothetical protein
MLISLDLVKFFKNNLINKKAKNFTGETLGLTFDDISNEYDRQADILQDDIYQNDRNENIGSLGYEADDIKRQIKLLESSFDKKHLTFQNIVELTFNIIVPLIVATVGLTYLYCFLIQ